jgi:hypothetical protein
MPNLLLEKIDYKIETTRRGTWKRYVYPSGASFAEFTAHTTLFGLPLVHYTRGICPETGRRVVAKGFIAVGRVAMGLIALGQIAVGALTVGQLALGLLLGLGQASTGIIAIGQLALGSGFGGGQIATGMIAIGQIGAGHYVLAQFGVGTHLWSMASADPEAVAFFKSLWTTIMHFPCRALSTLGLLSSSC